MIKGPGSAQVYGANLQSQKLKNKMMSKRESSKLNNQLYDPSRRVSGIPKDNRNNEYSNKLDENQQRNMHKNYSSNNLYQPDDSEMIGAENSVNNAYYDQSFHGSMAQYPPTQLNDEDQEMCAECNKHFVEGHQDKDMDWIGCEYEGCNKWYHIYCRGISP